MKFFLQTLILLTCFATSSPAHTLKLDTVLRIIPRLPELLVKEKPVDPYAPVRIPFKGYLTEEAIQHLRTKQPKGSFDRAKLVALPQPIVEEPPAEKMMEAEEKPKPQNFVDMLIENALSTPSVEEAPEPQPEPVVIEPIPEPVEPTQPQSTGNEQLTDFVNPDDILLYFETEVPGPNGNSTLGLPILAPNENNSTTAQPPSEGTYQTQ